ncbi:MAG TPA: immunoglobulin domain-containing protein, partial [Phycisphaerae bacterium]|nr:immunoglobulin domain-containing protein [Phycisphaerae bacterium]
WDGSDWIYLGSSGYSVKKLAVWNGRLIAGDSYDIAAWDGTNWESLGSLDDPIYSFGFWNGSLFAVGLFGSWMNPSLLAQWNGSDWIPTTPYTPVPQTQSTPFTMLSFAGDLYVGGDLAQVGTYPSSYLARMGPVLPFPQIAQGPASPLVCEGGVVSLQVTASGEGKLSYQWQKSGHNLTDSSSLLGTQTDTLVVAHAQLSDSGVYTCVVTLDGCAQHTTDGATLTVFGGNSADGNQDGLIDARDIQPFIDAITNFAPVSAQLCAYDLTSEGIVNLDDLPPFVTRLLAQ